MNQRQESSLPASLVNGRLEGLSVPDLLWNLCRRRSTGVLHLTTRGITKRVYIDSGRIVFALSSDPNDRLGDLLLREGQITLDQLENAILQLSSGKRLGTILVGAGHLSPEHLVRGVLSQVKGIVLALFPWEEGEYSFVEGPLPTEEVVTLGMRTAEILLQGIRQIRSFTRIRKSVGPPSTRFRLDPAWRTVLDGLDIRDGERMLLQRLDEAGARGIPVDAMCREVFLSNFEIYQALWAFLVLGVVDEVDRVQDVKPGGAIAGRVEHTALPEVLVRLAKDEATGVLHMARGAVERTMHIKAGQCVFATSSQVDDGLVAHLLRRGVISLADREETARRLLSNKRVGTILLEMGVIDEGDLRATVREQLSEIVFDTFRWDQGEFQFLEGELPTVEEITLTRSVEDLVFAGVRRVSAWSRVKDGCGGLGARLVLLPEYLSVLDKMTVGPEEWELISVLKTPKTVLEICRESVLGDFRSCQILWALRLLGGVGEAPLEVSLDTALGVFDAATATPVSEPAPEAVAEMAAEPARAPEPEPTPLPVSEADSTAEVISEPWRLAAERKPEPEPARAAAPEPSEPPAFALDSPADGTVQISRDDVEAALAAPGEHLPKFSLGEPGTGLEDMKVDMRPSAPQAFTLASAEEAAAEEAAAERAAAERAAEERAAEEHAAAERAAAELAAAEQAAAERAAAERAAAERAAEEQAAAERAAAERTAAEQAAAAAAKARNDQPVVPEAIDFDRTARLSREEIESALRAPAPPAAPAPAPVLVEERSSTMSIDLPAWEPPAELDGAIASFNARHVVLFRAMRAEIGAGAANFVRSCRGALDTRMAELFATAELRADGSWDPDGLRRAVTEHRMSNAADAFTTLLDGELQMLRVHMGEKRATALAEQLTSIG